MIELEKALNDYYEHFSENYPLVIARTMLEGEVVDDIEHCIESNEKAAKPKYKDDRDY